LAGNDLSPYNTQLSFMLVLTTDIQLNKNEGIFIPADDATIIQ
jgi:hypothetical protein